MDIAVESHHLDMAASIIGKQVLDVQPGTRQILVKSDTSYLNRLTLGSLNRDINPQWVEEMKSVMLKKIQAQERIQITACIDVRDIKISISDPEAGYDFKAVIVDGQHRTTALKELVQQYPNIFYEFRIEVFVIASEEEYIALLKELNTNYIFSKSDLGTVDARKRFIEVFNNLTKGHEHRRCVQRTKNHDVLRDKMVMSQLSKLSSYELEKKMLLCAATYKNEWEVNATPKMLKSALGQTIHSTGLYQLIHWETGKWIKSMINGTSV